MSVGLIIIFIDLNVIDGQMLISFRYNYDIYNYELENVINRYNKTICHD